MVSCSLGLSLFVGFLLVAATVSGLLSEWWVVTENTLNNGSTTFTITWQWGPTKGCVKVEPGGRECAWYGGDKYCELGLVDGTYHMNFLDADCTKLNVLRGCMFLASLLAVFVLYCFVLASVYQSRHYIPPSDVRRLYNRVTISLTVAGLVLIGTAYLLYDLWITPDNGADWSDLSYSSWAVGAGFVCAILVKCIFSAVRFPENDEEEVWEDVDYEGPADDVPMQRIKRVASGELGAAAPLPPAQAVDEGPLIAHIPRPQWNCDVCSAKNQRTWKRCEFCDSPNAFAAEDDPD